VLETKLKSETASDDQTKIALTSDIWTSSTNEALSANWKLHTPVLATVKLEEQHTADYLAQQLKLTAESCSIQQEQVSAIVHDGAAIVKDTGSRNYWKDVSCAAHKLRLAVTSALAIDKPNNSAVSKCVGMASWLVGHFHHSALATNEMLK